MKCQDCKKDVGQVSTIYKSQGDDAIPVGWFCEECEDKYYEDLPVNDAKAFEGVTKVTLGTSSRRGWGRRKK